MNRRFRSNDENQVRVSTILVAQEMIPDQTSHSPTTSRELVKVLYVISDLAIGGAEMMLYKLLAETDRERFDPVVISLIDRGALRARIEELGIPVHTTRMRPGVPSPLGFLRLVRLMRRIEPDLVLGWMYHSCLAAQLAGLFLRPRACILWSIHYSIESLANEKKLTAAVIKFCARLSKLADRIIFVSRASRDQHRRFGYDLTRSSVIPNGINTAEFVPSHESRASVRSELGLSNDALIIGMMGRYHPMKDHANFLQAASSLSTKYPDANFLLIGHGVDHQNAELCHSIKSLGLTRRTYLLSERYDTARLAAALDIFSLASYTESFPNVIGEAMACEVSCVVTDVGDARWIVGDTGRVVPPRNPRALAKFWEEMIELGQSGRAVLGRAARSRVIEHFTLESVVTRYENLFETVLAHRILNDAAVVRPALTGISSLRARFDDTAAQ